MIASGRSFAGLRASSLPVDTASKPMYAKKMIAAAEVIPSTPWGANGWKCAVPKLTIATAMKNTSTVSFTTTMTRFTRALSVTPRTSSSVIASTMNTAGRLKMPPADGDLAIASGRATPNAESRNALRLPPQPTAIAATDTPYSRIRSQPMIQATISPSVAYVYVYALPETGIDDASSAYDSAENVQATAASTNDRMTAGPAMPDPSPITTKMPVPMIAPTPIAVSCVALTDFLRPCPSSEVSVTSDPTSRTAKIPGFRP